MDLYRFYADDDRLLYIGISLHAAQRASEHKNEKSWWPDVARMDVQHLEVTSRSEAEVIEREAIFAERPMHNVAWNQRTTPISDDGPQEFDASYLGADVYAIQSALDASGRRMDGWAREGKDIPTRAEWIATIHSLARSVVYGDCCHSCMDICYPIALRRQSPTWVRCAYQCPKCKVTWCCGWTADIGVLSGML